MPEFTHRFTIRSPLFSAEEPQDGHECIPLTNLFTGAFACLSVSPEALLAQSTVQHPLDGLTSSEYWAVHDILHKSGHMTPDTGVSTLLLHEPLKSTVLAWKPGDPIEREADVVLEDKGQTIEARVDITAGKLESWNVIPGEQAPFTTTELHAFSDLIKSDPRVLAAFKKRDLTDMTTIHCGAGSAGLAGLSRAGAHAHRLRRLHRR